MRTFLITGLIMILLFTSAISETVVFGDHLKVAYCNEYITLREFPDSQSKALARIPLGDEVVWLYQSYNDFSYVYYKGEMGFAASKYLKLLPPTAIPECTISLPNMGNDPIPSCGLGTVYEIEMDDPYLICYDQSPLPERVVLFPGDEVILLSSERDMSYVEFAEHRLEVPNDILRLKEDYTANPIPINQDLRYRLNEFFTYLAQDGSFIYYYPHHAYSQEYISSSDLQRSFAVEFLRRYDLPIIQYNEEDSVIGGYYEDIEYGVIASVIDRFFQDANTGEYENWYSSVYFCENEKHPFFLQCSEDLGLGFACVDSVNGLKDTRYVVRFHVFDNSYNKYDPEFEDGYWETLWNTNNLYYTPAQASTAGNCRAEGFAIIHAPNGLESNRDWTVEYYNIV